MLKVEYPCREIFSSYQNPNKSTITWTEAKKHLHDVRLRRQNQLAINVNECHKLQTLHKELFNRQFDSNSTEKILDIKQPIKPINSEYCLHTNKYSIPRIEYAPIIYRKSIPTFETESSSKFDNNILIVKELTQYLSETSLTISNEKIENNRSLSPIKKDQQRHLSVSSVSSVDKRANKIYEKWPDYNQISEIVGYRIDPSPSKIITSDSISSRPSATRNQRKRNTTLAFPTTSKQIKNAMSLNPSPTRRKPSKIKQSIKTDITPIIIDQSLPSIEQVLTINPIKEIKPKLPNILCPSSVAYSNRIQTRQWLIKNNFSSNSIRTLPLI
ncbi:unnamed protein product [Rotaria sordida]|uniref:Uncharacterized protein n=1 Tax=Rotaria sordida TaxID=392033 RepID=A0A813ZRK0_9BILA|nr:unnamed protein product [Rotaria sordida]CAF1017232.1 unnamed protein product [Rotaria sordida]CAF1029880.1 unnamed protein product [Rotaria sordida]CAF3525481.1 unnamed protein product [Rotaria sordida]CAF3551284.1 unnamed protein product [Rotaria sordida]